MLFTVRVYMGQCDYGNTNMYHLKFYYFRTIIPFYRHIPRAIAFHWCSLFLDESFWVTNKLLINFYFFGEMGKKQILHFFFFCIFFYVVIFVV